MDRIVWKYACRRYRNGAREVGLPNLDWENPQTGIARDNPNPRFQIFAKSGSSDCKTMSRRVFEFAGL